jgi:hypothetical protein
MWRPGVRPGPGQPGYEAPEGSQVKTPGMPVFAGVGKHAFDIPVVLRGSSLISVLGENSLSFALYASIVDRFSAAPGARSSPPSR